MKKSIQSIFFQYSFVLATICLGQETAQTDEKAIISWILEQQAIFNSESAKKSHQEIRPKKDQTIVLVIEDNADLRHFIKDSLPADYAVFEAGDANMGWKRAMELVPDLIISDVMMPGLDGISLCHRLKTDDCTSHIAVILLTAKADAESKLAGLETGVDEYLTKPFGIKELQLRVHNQVAYRHG